mmetsp:Transcript_46458/g.121966  ORF Transcript_46458/g.121966 Transcript_46458/m.121966 type:complete len:223 (-) Transcript_46458:319-987(-)|eukprot:CAMPEP_0115854784 /NCGR_PEP_ID=MMETSP0287-20121206/14205_1 /TAXON_ID=412157 /ORGANISM="Chrysochromulina rotalis, Strain UIO044" /LENGTH=222 /DNA_ID=CAMNT_0003308917 /DNA_START=450 /DNA_END=1118 /DNA_ORIENTATION=+
MRCATRIAIPLSACIIMDDWRRDYCARDTSWLKRVLRCHPLLSCAAPNLTCTKVRVMNELLLHDAARSPLLQPPPHETGVNERRPLLYPVTAQHERSAQEARVITPLSADPTSQTQAVRIAIQWPRLAMLRALPKRWMCNYRGTFGAKCARPTLHKCVQIEAAERDVLVKEPDEFKGTHLPPSLLDDAHTMVQLGTALGTANFLISGARVQHEHEKSAGSHL